MTDASQSLTYANTSKPPDAAETSVALKLDQLLVYQLTVMSNWLGLSALRLYSKQFGLRSVTEWPIIAALGENAPLTAKRIAELTKFEKTRIARALKRLIACGYVVTRDDPKDGRRTLLWLTNSGAHLHDRLVPYAMRRNETLTATLSHEERSQLQRTMDKLFSQLPEVEQLGTADEK